MIKKLSDEQLADLSSAERATYHADRARAFSRRATIFAVTAVASAIASMILRLMVH